MANNQQELNAILQSCLEAIQSGEETIGSVLARYPEIENDLRPQLEAAYWLVDNKESFNPRPEFVSASRRRLMTQINQAKAVAAPPPRPTLWGMIANLGRKRLAVQFALAALILIFLIFGTSRAVLASQNTIPGDVLYPVKINQERIQLLFTLSDAGDAQLNARFAQRRLLEIQELILENRYQYIDGTVAAYQLHVGHAIEALRKIAGQDPSMAETIAAQLVDVLTRQAVVLAILSESVPQDTQQQLQRAMDVSQAGVITVQEIRQTAIAQATATSTPTPTITFTPTFTSTGLAAAAATSTSVPAATQTATPTSSITPLVTGPEAGTVTPGASATATFTPRPTSTQPAEGAPTATRTPTPTKEKPSPATPTSTATQVVPPSNTPTPTKTGVTPPTHTPTPTSTTQPAPTFTFTPTATSPVVPSPTWTPTATPVPPSPTPTTPPPPPTDTPVPKCSANINDLTGNKVDVLLQNLGGNSIRVVSVTIDWPISNEELKEVEMGGTTIWSGPINSSPYTIDQWSGDPGAREINPSGSRTMRFTFKRDAASNGYRIAVSFDNGCKVTARR